MRKRLPGLLLVTLLLGLLAATPRPLAATETTRLLAFGDSLIHGYGLAAGDTFPEQLEAALRARGHDVAVINGGNSGDTTAAGRARLDWALADEPDLVLIELGGNDVLRGLEPAETYRNLNEILARLKAEGLPVLLAGMRAPRNLGLAYTAEFDRIFPRLAAQHDVAFYPFFLEGVALDPALNQRDGIHPNAAGVAEIVERIVPALERLLNKRAAQGRFQISPVRLQPAPPPGHPMPLYAVGGRERERAGAENFETALGAPRHG